MRIQKRKPNGKWRTIYRDMTEKKAKDVMQDIYKNLTTNLAPVQISEDGMKITDKRMSPENPIEYMAQG